MPQFRAGQRLTADLLNLFAPSPYRSDQVNSPPFNVNATFTDFAEADFPPLEIDVPDGARLSVITSARLLNSNSVSSTCYLSWRAEGVNTLSDPFTFGFGSGGTGLGKGSNVHLTGALTGGLTKIVPQWYISSGANTSPATAQLTTGSISVEIRP